MIQTAPGATFEAYADGFATGIGSAGTAALGARIRDGAGANFLARTTTGITEDVTVASNGVYRRSFTAPTTAGQYWLIWDDGTTAVTEEIVVSFSTVAIRTGSVYATRDELKAALQLSGQDYADDDIDRACVAASRAIDNKTGRFYYSDTQIRYYTPDRYDAALDTIDVQEITELAVDISGQNTFSTIWTLDTDYYLEPFNAALTGRPYELIRIRRQSGKRWPRYQRSVRVTGTFGWAAIPDPVNQYAIILASKLLKRTREAPFGILSYGIDEPTAIRITRTDPDFELLLGDYVKTNPGI